MQTYKNKSLSLQNIEINILTIKDSSFMTIMQLNTDLFQGLSVIANDENLMKRAVEYIKKLADQKMQENDDTFMTKEDFFAKIERAHEQERRGEGITFTNKEDMNTWLNSL